MGEVKISRLRTGRRNVVRPPVYMVVRRPSEDRKKLLYAASTRPVAVENLEEGPYPSVDAFWLRWWRWITVVYNIPWIFRSRFVPWSQTDWFVRIVNSLISIKVIYTYCIWVVRALKRPTTVLVFQFLSSGDLNAVASR